MINPTRNYWILLKLTIFLLTNSCLKDHYLFGLFHYEFVGFVVNYFKYLSDLLGHLLQTIPALPQNSLVSLKKITLFLLAYSWQAILQHLLQPLPWHWDYLLSVWQNLMVSSNIHLIESLYFILISLKIKSKVCKIDLKWEASG